MAYFSGGVWENQNDVESDFQITLNPTDEILIAHYSGYSGYGSDYEMWARVLFLDTSVNPPQLYEVHGSHCSCYGLEGQWEPEPVSITDLVADLRMGRTWRHAGNVVDILKAQLRGLEEVLAS